MEISSGEGWTYRTPIPVRLSPGAEVTEIIELPIRSAVLEVVDGGSGQPLRNEIVEVGSLGSWAVGRGTDFEGRVVLESVPGTLVLRASGSRAANVEWTEEGPDRTVVSLTGR